MSILRPETGITSETPKNFLLDVGVVYVNFNIAQLYLLTGVGNTPANVIARGRTVAWLDPNGISQTPRVLGATQGGIEYSTGITQRQVKVDGARSNIKEFWRVDMIEPELKLNIIESNSGELMQKFHGAAKKTVVGSMDRITPEFVVDGDLDFWWNVVVVVTNSHPTKALQSLIILQNAHVSKSETLSLKDLSEAVLPITIVGNNSASDVYGDNYRGAEVWVPS